MNPLVDSLNFYLALGGVAVFLSSAILIVDLYAERALAHLVRVWGLFVAFLSSVGAGAMTLVYSEYFDFVPCGLCWLQRVFLYPQIFLLGAALYYKDKTIARYGIVLSVPGLIVALYQHYFQLGGSEVIACPTAGAGADCAKRILFEFGFITFPLLSAVLFAFLIVLYVYILRLENHEVLFKSNQ